MEIFSFLGISNSIFAAKIPVTVSLSGRNYLGYDLAQIGGVSQPILADREHLHLEFRTSLSDGLLFYTGKDGVLSASWLESDDETGNPFLQTQIFCIYKSFYFFL